MTVGISLASKALRIFYYHEFLLCDLPPNGCLFVGTRILLHLYSILHDPELWEDPEEFIPERFIVDGKLKSPDYFIPFSAGRRSCIGEQLARKELFLFFANLMQHFIICNPENTDLPSLTQNQAVVMYPNPFNVVTKRR